MTVERQELSSEHILFVFCGMKEAFQMLMVWVEKLREAVVYSRNKDSQSFKSERKKKKESYIRMLRLFFHQLLKGKPL